MIEQEHYTIIDVEHVNNQILMTLQYDDMSHRVLIFGDYELANRELSRRHGE